MVVIDRSVSADCGRAKTKLLVRRGSRNHLRAGAHILFWFFVSTQAYRLELLPLLLESSTT